MTTQRDQETQHSADEDAFVTRAEYEALKQQLQELARRLAAVEALASDLPRGRELALASERSLGEIWSTPEEDAAWANL